MSASQRFNGLRVSLVAVLFCELLISSACTDDPSKNSQTATPGSPPTLEGRPEHYGGDQLSWLTASGDNADSNFCDARLKLPLATEPTWEYSYTDAVFSSSPPREIVHYDGVLAITAHTTQLLGLDAGTGELLFNQDVFFDSGHPERLKRIQSLFFQPRGLLSARDDQGRVYCWDITNGNLSESWVIPKSGGTGGIVASKDRFFAGGSNQVNRINAVSGEIDLGYPTLFSNSNLLMSKSGLIVCWQNTRTKLIAFDSQGVNTKWVTIFDDSIRSAVIGEEVDRIFVTTDSEKLFCLDLQTGEQLWDYSWEWLLDKESRQARATLLRISQTRILPTQPMVGPWGYCLPLASGDVMLFSVTGELKWHYKADSAINGGIGFSNAILIKQFWEPVGNFSRPWVDPFNMKQPDWKEIEVSRETYPGVSEEAEDPTVRLGMFSRYVALDIENGTEIGAFEPDEYTYGRFIPAYNNIILNKVKGQRQSGSRRGLPKWVSAYNWLEEGSN